LPTRSRQPSSGPAPTIPTLLPAGGEGGPWASAPAGGRQWKRPLSDVAPQGVALLAPRVASHCEQTIHSAVERDSRTTKPTRCAATVLRGAMATTPLKRG
jgi:hypothetical protein